MKINERLDIDIKEAGVFLRALCDDTTPTFQTFDDNKIRAEANRETLGYDPYAQVFHGPLDQHREDLIRLQEQGAGCFVMVNEGDGRIHDADPGKKNPKTCRTARNVIRIRALFVDLDGAPLEPVLATAFSPHVIVESSPGRYHAYWKVHDCPIDRFTPLQKALIARFNGDKSVHDLPRVMRIPGFYHQKPETVRTAILDEGPFRTRILKIYDMPPYSVEDVRKQLDLRGDDVTERKSKSTVDNDPFRGSSEGGRTKCIERAAGVLFHRRFGIEEAVGFCEILDETQNDPPLAVTHPGKVRETVEGIHHRYYSAVWKEPTPLPDGLPPVKALDPNIIPLPLRGWLMDIAERMEIPPDYSAAAAMTALGSVIGRGCGIKPKRQDNWMVIPNTFGGVIGRPSLLKSPAIAEAMKPLDLLEAEERDRFKEDWKLYEFEKMVSKAKRTDLETRIKKAVSEGKDFSAESMKAELPNLDIGEPTRRRFLTSDVTPEKIIELLQQNPRGILIKRDELIGWFRSLDKEGREGARALYLEGWNGTGSYSYDTVGRGTLDVDALTLSVFGAITPGPLSTYVYQSLKGGGGDDGLLQRFQMLVWPDAPSDWKNIDRLPDNELRNRAFQVFRVLSGDIAGAVKEDGDSIPSLRFSEGGQAVFDAWRSTLERRLRGREIQCVALDSHLGKYRSLMPTLALIIHLANVADGIESAGPVSEEAATMAVGWCDYLESHAVRIYGAAAAPEMESARELARRIGKGDVENGCRVKEIYRHGWAKLETPEAVKAGLRVLEDYDWVTVDRVDTGGRPSEI
ncbi:MAG TPA: DUF3987 domain-containing protein, partial [Magnetospirillaceae bacterium]|nr:DUF3987 domain-containing protein [Magnetospirillaceae bacterium]